MLLVGCTVGVVVKLRSQLCSGPTEFTHRKPGLKGFFIVAAIRALLADQTGNNGFYTEHSMFWSRLEDYSSKVGTSSSLGANGFREKKKKKGKAYLTLKVFCFLTF